MFLNYSISDLFKKLLGLILLYFSAKLLLYVGFIPLAGVALWAADSAPEDPIELWWVLEAIEGIIWLIGAIVTLSLPGLCLLSTSFSRYSFKHKKWILAFCLLTFILPFTAFLIHYKKQSLSFLIFLCKFAFFL